MYYPISSGIRVAQSKRNVHPKPYVCELQILLVMPCKEDTRFTRLKINYRYRALFFEIERDFEISILFET